MQLSRRRTSALFAWLAVAVPLSFVWRHGVVFAESNNPAPLKTGQEIYRAACVSCHGADGRGAPRASVGFEQRLPDFTDCRFASREPDVDWMAIIHGGGPARGFSEIMPAFTEALSAEQIREVARYLRSFCKDRAWPRGELNLPRPLVTEKAFPEDEVVLTTTLPAEGAPAVGQEILYEKRFGARNQLEVKVPFQFERPAGRSWTGGVGDMALAWKRALLHSIDSGSIFSVSGEARLPTGDKRRGFGKGVTVLETFATYGQLLPRESFAQFQGGVELPTHTDDAPRAAFWRGVFGRTFTQGGGFGRAWSPMVELLADRELVRGERINWDLVPQLHVTLSKRQHIMANFGVRFPLNNAGARTTEIMFYLLWDWFDGGLREGW
jgi:mono/diheme cytochrome c family protein